MGTFAVVSLLTAAAITNLENKYVPPDGFNSTLNSIQKANNSTFIDSSNFLNESRERSQVLIAMALTFWV